MPGLVTKGTVTKAIVCSDPYTCSYSLGACLFLRIVQSVFGCKCKSSQVYHYLFSMDLDGLLPFHKAR